MGDIRRKPRSRGAPLVVGQEHKTFLAYCPQHETWEKVLQELGEFHFGRDAMVKQVTYEILNKNPPPPMTLGLTFALVMTSNPEQGKEATLQVCLQAAQEELLKAAVRYNTPSLER